MPGPVIGKVRNRRLPLTVVVVIFAIVVFEIAGALPAATPENIGPRLLALVAVSVLLSPFPALPVLYGWYSGNPTGAVLAGILPLPLFFIAGFFLLRDVRYQLPPC
jgi:hypothetical protein